MGNDEVLEAGTRRLHSLPNDYAFMKHVRMLLEVLFPHSSVLIPAKSSFNLSESFTGYR